MLLSNRQYIDSFKGRVFELTRYEEECFAKRKTRKKNMRPPTKNANNPTNENNRSSGTYSNSYCKICVSRLSRQADHHKSKPISERKYFFSKSIFCAAAKERARASSLFAPYELTAMTRPPAVSTLPSCSVVPA